MKNLATITFVFSVCVAGVLSPSLSYAQSTLTDGCVDQQGNIVDCSSTNISGGNAGSIETSRNTSSNQSGNITGSNVIGNNTGSNQTGNNTGFNETGKNTKGTGLIDPLQGGDLMSFLKGILAFVIKIGTIVIVLMLVYIGFLFATSSVNPENKNKAREALLWTVVGALILLGAQAIATGIEETVKALSAGK